MMTNAKRYRIRGVMGGFYTLESAKQTAKRMAEQQSRRFPSCAVRIFEDRGDGILTTVGCFSAMRGCEAVWTVDESWLTSNYGVA